ncbi:MAG TPA: peptide chain release factor 1 [Candidatus Marinimicrobia bacterium]|nr:peptide chain release factor 1 [Candidatus Neomarinimicrobiota bacterium]
MINKLQEIQQRFDEISGELANPDVVTNQEKYRKLTKEHKDLIPIVEKSKEYLQLVKRISEDVEILNSSDKELKELVNEEIEDLRAREELLQEELKVMLIPKDPNDDKNAIVEIRAGTGGDEAAIFAGDLYRMYVRYAERKHWKIEELSANVIGIGGFKEVIFSLSGQNVYGTMKFESGVHRVQRVPLTETSGRIHTSAATVAVFPEAEDVDVEIEPGDLRIDTYRASGAGGQHVNKVESAIRITHIPSGLVVTCQDEKSQHKNKAKALKILRSRLLAMKQAEHEAEIAAQRRSLVSTGDRSAKIKTYNFPQGRVTDHRINLTLYKLEYVMQGDLDELIEAVKTAHNMDQLQSSSHRS